MREDGEEIPEPRKVASGTIPFLDISPYKVSNSNISDREPRDNSDKLNFFNSRRKIERTDVQERLKRVNQELKRVWYIDELENTVDHIMDQ